MIRLKKLMLQLSLVVAMSFSVEAAESKTDVNPICDDANVFSNVFSQVCWDCFLDSLNLFGVGNSPVGGRSGGLVCACNDALGIPEFGYPIGFWSPTKLNEVVTTPWCSPTLGGIKLQDDLKGLGHNSMMGNNGEPDETSAFYQYHYFSYPLMTMLGILTLPACSDGYSDLDLMYMSEIDPLWNNDLLSLILNPEAIIFGNPAALAWCSVDCAMTTADQQEEDFYGCAGCDGLLYPLTGNVYPQPDPVAGSSLITQRVLASLHRKGLAHKTIGDVAMCDPEFFPMIPRSQYKFSMVYPVPEASNSESKEVTKPFIGNILDQEDVRQNDSKTNAGEAGNESEIFKDCCHPMGMSTSRWCTPVGGRTRPGKDNAYIYMIWNYRDCCVRS